VVGGVVLVDLGIVSHVFSLTSFVALVVRSLSLSKGEAVFDAGASTSSAT
jgi:hypothetical protein